MYELSRVALQSVGPTAARYQNVLLDFSSVGSPVADRRMSLFGAGVPARRPSPATVLFLENGGGKSVLIKLIFSVVLPGRRQTVGASGSGVLEQFVLPKDTAHVVLEWTHARSGRRLITGKVMEWKDRRESSDSRNLLERWYHFRPTDSLCLDNLPFSTSSHYRTQTDYLLQLAKTHAADPTIEYSEFVRHREWTERLVDLGLDSELFKYQRSMNADEGEAAEAFSFASDIAFVNFLLSAVLPSGPARALSDLLDTYAGRLHRRTELLLEQDFARGALDVLQALAEARADADRARVQRRGSARNVAVLLGRLKARAQIESSAAGQIREESELLAGERTTAQGELSRLAAATSELERLLAELRWQDTRADAERAQEQAAAAEAELAAWKTTPVVLRHLTAERQVSKLRAVVEDAEEAARPALVLRDEAAALLVRALTEGVGKLREKAELVAAMAEAAAAQAEADQVVHNEGLARAISQVKEADAAEQRVREVNEAVASAVEDGLISPGASAASALKDAAEAAAANARRLIELEEDIKRLEAEQEAAAQALRQAEGRLSVLHRALDAADEECKAGAARRDALAAEPAFLELLGHMPEDLETAAETLRGQLAEVQDKATAEITDLHVAQAQDERSRLALESTELLPSSPEAARVKEILAENGITAWTGWEYLAAFPDLERRRSLARLAPHLVNGVLLNDAAQLRAAQEVVNSRKPHPSVFLAVGTTEAITHARLQDCGVGFVVDAHPALYDERAADVERQLVRQRHERRMGRLTELSARRAAASALIARVQEWRRDFPPGRLAELQRLADERRLLAESGEQEVEGLQTGHDALVEARSRVLEEADPVRAAQRGLDECAHRLAGLADLEGRIAGWESAATLHRQAGEREREAARKADEAARRGREQAATLLREVDGMRASASRLTEELAGLPSDPQTLRELQEERANAPLEVLRRDYKHAAETYLRASVGDQLIADLRQAEKEVTLIAAELDDQAETVALARDLLSGPSGADAASRELARRLAEQATPELRLRAAELGASAARRKEEYEAFAPPETEVDLTPFERPRHVGHGMRLVEEARLLRDGTSQNVIELGRHGQRLAGALEQAELSHRGFSQLLLGSEEFIDYAPITGMSGPEPFEGELSSAAAECQAARSAYDDARRQETAAEDEERRLADRLVRHASRSRFLPLETSSRKIILEIERPELPGRAAEWATAMRGRVRSLTDDLETIDRHRDAITRQLAQQVMEALETLRRAERFSQLPKGLGDWSGQFFLKIQFKKIPEEALLERMGLLVDDMAKSTIATLEAGREPKRDGLSLILKGVAAAAPRGFKVTILKPDSVLLAQKVPVSDIRAVFSGGQLLTTAIILYCTMAALRANDRGRVGHQHSGVLFLDNPIGRASTTYLLRLQQSVAQALGVQLVYTTGLFDTNALDTFPLVIRLRNDTDLRARRRYLSVERAFGRYLDESLSSDGPQISASRYFTRKDSRDKGE
ncbi:hypothetical protein [Streptomyces sp. NPDC005385]|uniref:hypothetical protein n=1 Tax=Streptomyces sp. NPDC005385 TaxID=3157039 RepID=UPI0033A1332C